MNNSLCGLIRQETPFESSVVQASTFKAYPGDSNDIKIVMVGIFAVNCQNSTDELSEKLES